MVKAEKNRYGGKLSPEVGSLPVIPPPVPVFWEGPGLQTYRQQFLQRAVNGYVLWLQLPLLHFHRFGFTNIFVRFGVGVRFRAVCAAVCFHRHWRGTYCSHGASYEGTKDVAGDFFFFWPGSCSRNLRSTFSCQCWILASPSGHINHHTPKLAKTDHMTSPWSYVHKILMFPRT